MARRLSCVFCKEFCILTDCDGSLFCCDAGIWNALNLDELKLQRNIVRGLICPDFVLVEMPWLGVPMRKLLEGEGGTSQG